MKKRLIEKLEKEMLALDYELKVTLPKELKTAADHGDLSENAEYDAAKERKRFVEARISQIQKRISEIIAINLDILPKDRVGLGSKVFLERIDNGERVEYRFVFPEDVDPTLGKISLASPSERSLVGRYKGDEVLVVTPKGKVSYDIVDLVTIHDADTDDEE